MTNPSDLSDVLASIEDVLAGDFSPMRPATIAPAEPREALHEASHEVPTSITLEPPALTPIPPRVEARPFAAALRVHPDKPQPAIGAPRATGTVAEFMASLRLGEVQ